METLLQIPAWTRPNWVDGRVTNFGDVPLWSGAGDPPAIGSVVETSGRVRLKATIQGYYVSDRGRWLMAVARRHHDGIRGDLTGSEIHYGDD